MTVEVCYRVVRKNEGTLLGSPEGKFRWLFNAKIFARRYALFGESAQKHGKAA